MGAQDQSDVRTETATAAAHLAAEADLASGPNPAISAAAAFSVRIRDMLMPASPAEVQKLMEMAGKEYRTRLGSLATDARIHSFEHGVLLAQYDLLWHAYVNLANAAKPTA